MGLREMLRRPSLGTAKNGAFSAVRMVLRYVGISVGCCMVAIARVIDLRQYSEK